MIAVVFANGFEEIEALTVVDVLHRAGNQVKKIGLDDLRVTGAHDVLVEMDDVLSPETMKQDWNMLVLPGGPGTMKLNESPLLKEWIQNMVSKDKYVAAICAAPVVLGSAGVLEGKRFTCYPGMEKYIENAQHTVAASVTDGFVITGHSPGEAMNFSLALVEALNGLETKQQVERPLFRL